VARLGMGTRIVALFFLILGLVFGGLYWFDFLGVISAGQILSPITSLFGVKHETINVDDPTLLDSVRIRKQEEAIDLKFQELGNKQNDLAKKDRDIQQKVAEIDEREKSQDDREKSFNEKVKRYDDQVKNLEQNSKYLTSMPPDDAVKILDGYDDQLLIDTLRSTQELADAAGSQSLVPLWLSKLPPARAAEIQRKMTLKPTIPQ